MMGHREELKGGYEHDCAGHPQHRWRKCLPKGHRKWSYVKNRINRRNRREGKKALRVDEEL